MYNNQNGLNQLQYYILNPGIACLGNSSVLKIPWVNLGSGTDPEILKGGCTKFSGPKLPYSGFDSFLNLL